MASCIKESLQAARCRLQQTVRDGEALQARLAASPRRAHYLSRQVEITHGPGNCSARPVFPIPEHEPPSGWRLRQKRRDRGSRRILTRQIDAVLDWSRWDGGSTPTRIHELELAGGAMQPC